ncbi:MAG: metal-dependent hydrolase [Chloroflexota bacterium]|nr:metal-dependent hydrolase [Chloroflexota bacterium]MDE2839810.1 metal-dependent hydrolase [Chloroflexota bacterium]MDE2932042.1 metal-dependent hydrolase [Chloroflexota bacterium]
MAANGISITWLGHAAFSITTPENKVVLIDPFLEGNPVCPDDLKKPDTVDAILITHGHGDHLGDTVSIAQRTEPEAVVTTADISRWLEQQGVANIVGMNKGGTIHVVDLAVMMVHAEHTSTIMDGDTLVPAGESVGYVVTFSNGLKLYVAGDTALFGDMALIGRRYQPDIAILPIGDHFTMGPDDAAEACRMLGVQRVIPCHYGTFPLLTGTPYAFRAAARDICGLEINELQPGETICV